MFPPDGNTASHDLALVAALNSPGFWPERQGNMKMRHILLASVAALGLAITAPAFAARGYDQPILASSGDYLGNNQTASSGDYLGNIQTASSGDYLGNNQVATSGDYLGNNQVA